MDAKPLCQRLLTLDCFERASARVLPHAHREWIADGAADGYTLRANREAWAAQSLDLMPRGAVDVSTISLSTSLLGGTVPIEWPVLIAPTSYQKLAHPDGEIACAKAAVSSGTIFVGSHAMSHTSEEVAEAARAEAAESKCDSAAGATEVGLWQQLYFLSTRDTTLDFVHRVERAGKGTASTGLGLELGAESGPGLRPARSGQDRRYAFWDSGQGLASSLLDSEPARSMTQSPTCAGYSALVVTVDGAVGGLRERGIRAGFAFPPSVT